MIAENVKVEINEGDQTRFELTLDRLGTSTLASSNGFALTTDALNVGRLTANPTASENWVDYSCDFASVQIRRGLTQQGINPKLDAGILSASGLGVNVSPIANYAIRPGVGVRVRAYDGATWQTLYTGTTDETRATHDKQRFLVSLSATDAVERLNNLPTEGAAAQSTEARINSLMPQSALTWTEDIAFAFNLDAHTEALTLLEQMEVAIACEPGFVFVDSGNAVRFTEATGGSPVIEFSNVHSSDPLHLCYSDIETSYDTSRLVNQLEVKNLHAGGVTTYFYEDATSVATWGPKKASATTNFASSGLVDSWASVQLSNHSQPALTVTRVTVSDDEVPALIAGLEILDTVSVEFAHNEVPLLQTLKVLSIEHDITPYRWNATINLTKEGI